MTIFVALQSTYHQVELALFKEDHCLDQITIAKAQASSHILVELDALLRRHAISLANLTFIAANQGPSPFTTLRVVIATINGLSFASHLPLVGVDGLEALVHEYWSAYQPLVIALLNAFNHDLYYAIGNYQTSIIVKGCKKADILLAELKAHYPMQPLYCIGNGTELYSDLITQQYTSLAKLGTASYCSLQQIGKQALAQWHHYPYGQRQLLPLYLKSS
jgi:tRNA threonylcarbamoyl adenosine modification protein YeaZ